MLQLTDDDKLVPFLDDSMNSNPHLLEVLQYWTVVWTIRFLGVVPPPEEGRKFLLGYCATPIVRVVEGLPYFRAEREYDIT